MPTMTTMLDYDAWFDKYKPVANPFDKNAGFNGTMLETYGKEEEHVYGVDYHYVWTYTSDEEDIISNGRGYVNRMGYFITEVPWHEDDLVFINLTQEEQD